MESSITGALLYSQSTSLGLQIAQSRSYLHTLGPKVGMIYILGAIGHDQENGEVNIYKAIILYTAPTRSFHASLGGGVWVLLRGSTTAFSGGHRYSL